MGHFYFDETIQERGAFIIGAFVYSQADATPDVYAAIEQVGLRPGVDEFKSGIRMDRNPRNAELRDLLTGILGNTRIGLVVVPAKERASLGHHALGGLRRILAANNLAQQPHSVFLDQGIRVDQGECKALLGKEGAMCEVHQNQDSKLIGGIQLADLAAHLLGGMLLDGLGLVSKTVRAGENSGYEPDLEIDLGFALWAALRYQFFRAPRPNSGAYEDDPVGDLMFDVTAYGLHISDGCSQEIREAALRTFGTCYLGCIH